METRQVPVVLVLAACVGVLVTVPVVGVGVGSGQSPQVDNTTAEATATDGANGSFGGQISAFMQTSAVDANDTVEGGMFTAAVDGSESPAGEVTSRADRLERQLEGLERKATRLDARRANGTVPDVAYTAQASAVRERIANLRGQINGTAATAERVGVDVSALDRLRTQAANLTGPEMSALARTITDAPRGPPAGVPGGPSGNAGPPGEAGPPGDTGPSGTVTGPPETVGPPDADGQTPAGDGPPEATGPGTRTEPTGPPETPVDRRDSDTGPPNGTDGRPGADNPRGDNRQGNTHKDGQRDRPTDSGPPSDVGPRAMAVGPVGTATL